MSNTGKWRAPGYLMAEAVITLAILSILAAGFAGLVTAGVEHVHRITERLEAERTITAALVSALALTRDGVGVRDLEDALQREHPGLTVTVRPGRLLLDAGSTTRPVTVLLPDRGVTP